MAGGEDMNYCERLRILRERKGLSQKQVADYLQTTQSYYAQYERNLRQMPFDRAIELAKLYQVSLDYIAGLTDILE